MRYRLYWVVIWLVAITGLTSSGCGAPSFRRSPGPIEARSAIEIERIVGNMSVEEKVGQLLMVGFDGDVLTESVAEMLRRYHVGGIILFGKNVSSANQLQSLISSLQRVGIEHGPQIPLLIATDQEAGGVMQVSVATEFPDTMALGAAGSEQLAYDVGYTIGKELKALGINVNLAPVLDVNTNPRNPVIGIRSFGDNPAQVARLGVAYIRGLKSAGVLSVGKHFPGHGDAELDTHFSRARITVPLRELQKSHLVPFERSIAAGVDMIMLSHLVVPSLTEFKEVPITLSRAAVTDFLRIKMGFNGVVITDSMQMAALLDSSSFARACVEAIKAGVDLLLLPYNFPKAEQKEQFLKEYKATVETAHEALLSSVLDSGPESISEEELDKAVGRVLRLKKSLSPSFSVSDSIVKENARLELRAPSSLALAKEVAERGLAWIKPSGRNAWQKLRLARRLTVLSPVGDVDGNGVISPDEADVFGLEVSRLFADKDLSIIAFPFSIGRNPPLKLEQKLFEEIANGSKKSDVIIIGISKAEHVELVEFVQHVVGIGTPIFLVNFGSPYLAEMVRGPVNAYLSTFSLQKDSLKAAARALAGTIQVTGRSPVSLIPGFLKTADSDK